MTLSRALLWGALAMGINLAHARDLQLTSVVPLTGPLANSGRELTTGGKVYFDYINAQGGINGGRIVLKVRDDGYDAARTVQETRAALAEEQPLALFFVVGTGNVNALVKEHTLESGGLPLIGVRTGAKSLRDPALPLLFHTRASYQDEIERIVQQLGALGLDRVGVMYQDDGFGKDGLAALEAAAQDHKLTVVARGSYPKNTTEVDAAVKTMLTANPLAVVLVSNTAATSAFLKQYRGQGGRAQAFTLSVTEASGVVKAAGVEAARGLAISQVMPRPDNPTSRVGMELQRLYAKYGDTSLPITYNTLEGFVTAKALVEGLRHAGANPDRKKLVAALEGLGQLDVGGYMVNFAPGNHVGSRMVELSVINAQGKLMH